MATPAAHSGITEARSLPGRLETSGTMYRTLGGSGGASSSRVSRSTIAGTAAAICPASRESCGGNRSV